MKLAQDCHERQLSFNELILLGIYRAMHVMPKVTDAMKQAIVARIDMRFTFSHKFMRMALKAAREQVWVYHHT
jgi:hypothetical protein